MSFKRLRDLRDRFESKWINGGFIFGYENEINESHNNDYPLLLVLPPTSELPSTEGDSQEEYTFECLIVKPYFQNQTGSLDVVFSLLEQESLSWLQRVLDSYENKDVILSPDSISVEREKELYNDKLIQIRLTFTLNCFSHNFSYIDELSISNLSPRVWLRSDMGVKTTYNGGNEVVSKWIDQSGNGNHFEQSTSTKMPSYEYELTDNGYPFLQFDGVDDFMSCVNNGISDGGNGISSSHAIFFVAKVEQGTQSGFILSKNISDTDERFHINARFNGTYSHPDIFYRDDDTDNLFINASSDDLSQVAVFAVSIKGDAVTLFKNGTSVGSDTDSDYDDFSFYDNTKPLHMGSDDLGSSFFLNMKMQEMIIFNSKLEEAEVKEISTYLQHKYNI